MNAVSMIDMNEATRLTRQGRLAEAMALLQGALRPAEEARTPVGNCSDDATVIDMQPPAEAGGAWSPPLLASAPGRRVSAARQEAPSAMQEILDRVKSGTGAGLGGLLRTKARGQPAPLPDGARFDEAIYANEAGSRTYKLYVPSGYQGQALPLIVMLHGCTQSPDDFAAGTGMNELAEEQMFFVAYPAQPQSANASKCWNWFNSSDQRRDQGEPSLIAGITRKVMIDYSIKSGRVYIAGLSAGGAAAAIMGSTYPDVYAAIGVHSGLACGAAKDMPSAFAAMQGGAVGRESRPPSAGSVVPTIVFHGDRDRTVSSLNGDQVIAQSKAGAKLRASVSRGVAPGGRAYTRTNLTDENGRPVIEQWVLHGAGHAWSGGKITGSYTDPTGPDASREMVRFFMQQEAVGD